MAEAVLAQRDYLSSLDATVGDGDHGMSLTKALQEGVRQLAGLEGPTPESVLHTAGMAIQNTMGGASGVLFGAFFIGAAGAINGKAATSLRDVAAMLAEGLAEVQKRGKAQPGDKTIVDALAPAVAALQAAEALNLAQGLRRAAEAAQAGAAATREMVARHGRAKFLGERSRGYQDAGATSMAIMLAALAEAISASAHS